MTLVFLSSLQGILLGWLMGFLSLFLVLLVLVQRGRGGGLTGALGGPGGQSAFGSKAGDTFTVITVAVAAIWGFVCAFTMWLLGTHTPVIISDTPPSVTSTDNAEDTDGLTIPAADSMGLSGIGAGGADLEGDGSNVELVPADGSASEGNSSSDDSSDGAPSAEASDSETDSSEESASSDSDSSEESPTTE